MTCSGWGTEDDETGFSGGSFVRDGQLGSIGLGRVEQVFDRVPGDELMVVGLGKEVKSNARQIALKWNVVYATSCDWLWRNFLG